VQDLTVASLTSG
nr:immunoglobulin heavy chain junction region [Mus musculus]